MEHPDLVREQAHLDRTRHALIAMADRTTAALAGTESAATEADSEVARWHLRRRLDSLVARDDIPAFGRIDAGPDTWYVGRRHIEDEGGDPLVVDWRAPVSVPFYRATMLDSMGLDGRRRFMADGTRLVDIVEEDFNDPEGSAVSGGIPDPLLAELERERTGSMRDIVATIAGEQDEIIRAPLDRLLIVQGGPGTGKTAVALHRAAFLLFEHRMMLMDSGVLVIGPNPVFLRYVADVLPSLGETAVRQTTIEGLRASGLRVGAPDPPAVGRLKGDIRMADVIEQALRDSITLPSEVAAFSTTWGRVVFEPDDAERVVEEVLARRVAHSTGRDAVRTRLLHLAYERHEATAEVPAVKSSFLAGARSDRNVKRYLDRLWPAQSAPALVQKLLGSAAFRRRATAGILTAAEADSLGRPVAKKRAEEVWSPADLALLDEAEHRIGGTRVTYGHIVVDEAQDLSAMALRMLARRSATGSMTIVGDLAQGTQPWSQESWQMAQEALQGKAPTQFAELTVGYRTPAPILDLANRLLPFAAPDVTPARSIRDTGVEPLVRPCDRADVAAVVVDELDRLRSEPGTIALITAADLDGELTTALDAAGIPWGRGADGTDAVAVLTPLAAKGLEFDTVVVAEPQTIVEREPAGVRALFVALSRPTRELVLVASEAVPLLQ